MHRPNRRNDALRRRALACARSARRRSCLLGFLGRLEALEPRTLLSAWYDYDIPVRTGDAAAQGGTINSISDVSINSRGRVAFDGATAGGTAIFVDDGPAATAQRLNQPGNDFFAQINDSGRVISRDVQGGGSAIRIYDSNVPGNFVNLATTLPDEPPPPIAPFTLLTFPSIANDGGATFVGTTAVPSTHLYRNPTGARGANSTVAPLSGNGWRPMAADGGDNVIADVGGPASRLRINGNLILTVGVGGWTALGRQPGISEDGDLVAFAGNRGNGPGIFLVRRLTANTYSAPERIAGEATPPAPANPVADLGFDDAGNRITFTSFDMDARVAVTRTPLGGTLPAGDNGDTAIVSFIGTPSAASRNNPTLTNTPLLFTANRGLWTVRVKLENELNNPPTPALRVHVSGAVPVAQVGETIAGFAITDLAVQDPLTVAAFDKAGTARTTIAPGDHIIAFRATNAAGQTAIIRAYQLDTDEDGLYDHWERAGGGIDINRDGAVDLALSAWGASVTHKDMFIEADWTVSRPGQWNNSPQPGVFQYLVNTFLNSPVMNPDGTTGIRVHVDAGASLSIDTGTGSRQGGDTFSAGGQHPDVVYFGAEGSMTAPGVVTRSFGNVKDNLFGTTDKRARELAFRYLLFADTYKLFYSDAGGTTTPFIGNVTAATANTLTTTSGLNVFHPGGGAAGPLAGKVLKITAGRGAGQMRPINAVNVGTGTITVGSNWATTPDNTSQFALFTGSSGRAEVGFYPANDFGSISGNDLIVTLAGFGVTNGRLGSAYDMQRTIVHELGHTLGLRHGGIDHVSNKGNNYLSLMSYSHQLANPSAVNSYSGAADPTYDDWRNVQLGFQRSLFHLGNSLGLGFGAEASSEDEPSLDRVQAEQISGPLDYTPPTAAITSPAPNATVNVGGSVAVTVSATDNSAVASVLVTFDTNGDGDVDDAGEQLAASFAGGSSYTATFANVAGPAGSRAVNAQATDTSGTTTDAVAVNVNVSSSSDTTPPTVLNSGFDFETRRAVVITFSEPVGGSVAPSDLVLENLTTGATIVIAATDYTPATNAAAFILPAGAGDGNYRATLQAGSIADPAGNLLAAPTVVNFFIFAGDANRSRSINVQDFSILASNFNKSGSFSQGDFNYSGTITIQDFSILASKFNTGLAAARAAALPSLSRLAPFGVRRVVDGDLVEDLLPA
jgi:hypothetical protein